MIEFSLTELALLVWAVIATGYAMRYKAERGMVSSILQHVVENPEVAARIGADWQKKKDHLSRTGQL